MKKMKYFFLLLVLFFSLGATMTAQAKTISITKKTFPDSYVRKVLKKYDKNHDGKLSTKEQKKVKKLSISKRKQVDLKGIRKLGYLETVNLNKVKVKHPKELAGLKKVKNITVIQTNLTSLKLINPLLASVSVQNNCLLSAVNLSGCKKLDTVDIQKNSKLVSLDLHNCKYLYSLTDRGNTKLTMVNVLGDSRLNEWQLDLPKGKQLQMNAMSSMDCLDLYNTEENSFDFSKVGNLSVLYFTNCTINESSFAMLPNLKKLAYENCTSLNSLNFSLLSKLKSLHTHKCHFGKDLNLTGLKQLEHLYWADTDTESINLADATLLTSLSIPRNKLTGDMKFGAFKNLTELSVSNNKITSIDANGCSELLRLDCRNNALKTLQVSKCNKIDTCYVTGNPEVEIYINFYIDYEAAFTYDNSANVHS